MKNQPAPGMKDLISEASIYRRLEDDFFKILKLESFKEIRTPILESKNLFSRSVGDASDIVEKEMFETKTDDLVLRPENTAAIVRAVLNDYKVPAKFGYFAPQFRKERPQLGRLRQFYQYGFEMFGDTAPQSEIESLLLISKLYKKWGLSNYEIQVNYLGSGDERSEYLNKLTKYFTDNKDKLSDNSKKRLEKNVLRILDSKEKEDQDLISSAPLILDSLSESSLKLWNQFLEIAKAVNLKLVINPRLVRGLDYYTGMVFEVVDTSGKLGSQKALGGGGRYDNLCKELGGMETPAFGFAGGVERLIIALDLKDESVVLNKFGLMTTELEVLETFVKIKEKNSDIYVDILFNTNLGFKKMFKRADKNNLDYVLIVGKDELLSNSFKVKNLKTGEEKEYTGLSDNLLLKNYK